MKFVYDGRELTAGETCWLLANGLGGYMSTGAAFSADRCDCGLLVAAEGDHNRRAVLVQRLRETLETGEGACFLSAQTFADGRPPEEGFRYLRSFVWDGVPEWEYQAGDVTLRRRCGMAYGSNASAVVYEITNNGSAPCTLSVSPSFLMAPKGEALSDPPALRLEGNTVSSGDRRVYLHTNGSLAPISPEGERLAYPRDGVDGRAPAGYNGRCCVVSLTVQPGETGTLELAFSDGADPPAAGELVRACARRQRGLRENSGFRHSEARELAGSADAFAVQRRGGGATVLAGYPFFEDWGRDTMIALPGCVLATGRYEDAKSILRTFLAHERGGLVPNLFPEGTDQPMYNTADAALLLINCVWLYWQRTRDEAFVREGWPVLERIINGYRNGTDYGIAMDGDGLIRAGKGLDQVTWMDVRVGDILPTPRHGKPVEINAYWYNALCIMRELASITGADGRGYGALAETARSSFVKKFWMEDKGYLRDVLSGAQADEQLRCNQIWAVSMPFAMLSPWQERSVVETVYRELWTPQGLRTLSPKDPQFCPAYAGSQFQRDMAYHQGTVWPFPLGGFYLAWLKVHGYTKEAAAQVEGMLRPMEDILREGCVGQLPEVYDGLTPTVSKGCFAQAWSVGELLRVYEALERIQFSQETR